MPSSTASTPMPWSELPQRTGTHFPALHELETAFSRRSPLMSSSARACRCLRQRNLQHVSRVPPRARIRRRKQGRRVAGEINRAQKVLIVHPSLLHGILEKAGKQLLIATPWKDDALLKELPRAFDAEGHLQDGCVEAQLLPQRRHGHIQVRPEPIHLVDEAHGSHAMLLSLSPDRLRLRLDARCRVQHQHGAVQHADAPLHLLREVHVARGVDQEHLVASPPQRHRCALDSDASLAFLLEKVRHRGAIVHFSGDSSAQIVPSERQHALSGRGLPGINVGNDSHVSHVLDVHFARFFGQVASQAVRQRRRAAQ
eukprot:scaffold263_cov251-Pinguiococcus_pyrenoidosus.AAC.10